VRSKEIRVYGAPGVKPQLVSACAAGVKSLVDELGLDFAVRAVPLPEDARTDYQESAVTQNERRFFDFDRFEARRLAHRRQRYGEMLISADPFLSPSFINGLAYFPAGLSVAYGNPVVGATTARHETGHLLGYDRHDDSPWWILGYAEAWYPEARQTLMVFNHTASQALSPRARDALCCFWQGEEGRCHVRFFR
jgi:hypothetical protein